MGFPEVPDCVLVMNLSVPPSLWTASFLSCHCDLMGNKKAVTYMRAASPEVRDPLGWFLGELKLPYFMSTWKAVRRQNRARASNTQSWRYYKAAF